MREYRKNPENARKHREMSARWYRENHQRARTTREAYRLSHPPKPLTREQQRRYELRYLAGITQEQYETRLAAQGGGCWFCGRRADEENGKCFLSVDHDHATGRPRGLLCLGCNVSLGHFERGHRSRLDPDLVAEYLAQKVW